MTTTDDLTDTIAALQATLIAERARAARVEAELAVAKARAYDDQALIAHQRLQIEKLTRQIYGQRSERTGDCSTSSSWPSRSSRVRPPRTRSRRAGRRQNHQCAGLDPQAPGLASPSPSICRASGWSSGGRRTACAAAAAATQVGRGPHRKAGGHPTAVEGDPARPREVYLPRLREDQPGAGAVPCAGPGLGRSQPIGDSDPVREIRAAPALEPASRSLCP